ncbi:hypothetical protein EJB05_55150, partial [Eragrostis curvula]
MRLGFGRIATRSLLVLALDIAPVLQSEEVRDPPYKSKACTPFPCPPSTTATLLDLPSSASSLPLSALGFRFNPTPQEAITYTLPRLIAGEPMHPDIRPYLHDADIYACEPGVRAAQFQPTPRAGDRFFFTTCKRQPSQKAGKSSRAVRAAGPGSWHSQGNTTDVKDVAGVKIGEVKKLRYKKGGKFTDWLMDEFSCCSQDAVVGDTQLVLCKIYVSPRPGPDSAARQEDAAAAAVFAPPAPEKPVAASKRPAPPIDEPPCPKRRRQEVASLSTPSATGSPASTLAPTRPVQAMDVAQAACSPVVAARDPFCTEMTTSTWSVSLKAPCWRQNKQRRTKLETIRIGLRLQWQGMRS